MKNVRPPGALFGRGSFLEVTRVGSILRRETVGGALLLLATLLALGWANSPWSQSYLQLQNVMIGPSALHLDLTLSGWAADGLLAIFFFVAGLELKREFVDGAFALAVLAVISTHLPAALRTFLLTLAVVDHLLAITIIAIYYTTDLSIGPLLLALLPLAVFTVLVQRRVRAWWLLLALAFATWALVHASGVHATVAGVLLGFAVPVTGDDAHCDRVSSSVRPSECSVRPTSSPGSPERNWTSTCDGSM